MDVSNIAASVKEAQKKSISFASWLCVWLRGLANVYAFVFSYLQLALLIQ
jgi:hypothetical protein